jgi:membrane peptidoglycan carboxypeptidase
VNTLFRRILLPSAVLAVIAVFIAVLWGLGVKRDYADQASSYNLSEIEKMELASEVLDRYGNLLGKFYIMNREPIELSSVSPTMIDAILAAEDQRFWEHGGVDWIGVARAFWENLKSGRVTQGASTITQQLARNSFNLKGRSYSRKLLEMALASRIEEAYDKRRIVELYLNRIYFGSGFYGVESAARGYFGVGADSLTAGQAATLAGIIRSPNALSPFKKNAETVRVRNAVLLNMKNLGFLSNSQYEEYKAAPIGEIEPSSGGRISYALEMVRQEVIEKLGYDQTMSGGLIIETTLDGALQKKAEISLLEGLDFAESHQEYKGLKRQDHLSRVSKGKGGPRRSSPEYLQGAVVAAENSGGGILALVGGRSFEDSEYNRASQMSRPPAQAFAPFVVLSALSNGKFAGTVLQDWPLDNKFVGIGGVEGILGEWGVESRENRYEGPVTVRDALAKGKNSALARLGFAVGLDTVGATASDLGIPLPSPPLAGALLGSFPVSPMNLTRAFMVFPNGGEIPAELYLVERVTSSSGKPLFEHKSKKNRVVAHPVSYQVHSMLEEGMRQGPASRAKTEWGLENPNAVARSGTSYDFKDAWFVGYDSKVTCVVWIGFDRPSSIFEGAFGSVLAAPIWSQVMNAASKKYPGERLLPPFGLKKVEVCQETGELASPDCYGSPDRPIARPPREEYDLLSASDRGLCELHSGRVKSYTKEFEDSGWPRAAQVADLSLVRPVDVASVYVVGSADPYGSVSPLNMGNVAVASAVPVTTTESGSAEETSPDKGSSAPSPKIIPDEAASPLSSDPDQSPAPPEAKSNGTKNSPPPDERVPGATAVQPKQTDSP